MNSQVILKKDSSILYEGLLINIPFKEEIVINMSIDLFDDDDPCIIHKSYVYKELASSILEDLNNCNPLIAADYKSCSSLDFNLNGVTLTLK